MKAQKMLRNKIAYLFQNFALLENKSVLYNLELVFDWKVKKKMRQTQMEKALRPLVFMKCVTRKYVNVPVVNSNVLL